MLSEAESGRLASQYARSATEQAAFARRDRERALKSFEIYNNRAGNRDIDEQARKLYADMADAADQLVAWYELIEEKAATLSAHLRKVPQGSSHARP